MWQSNWQQPSPPAANKWKTGEKNQKPKKYIKRLFADIGQQAVRECDPSEKLNKYHEPHNLPGFLPAGISWSPVQRGDPSREQQSHWAEETKIGVWGGSGSWNLWGRDLHRRDPGRKGIQKSPQGPSVSVDGHHCGPAQGGMGWTKTSTRCWRYHSPECSLGGRCSSSDQPEQGVLTEPCINSAKTPERPHLKNKAERWKTVWRFLKKLKMELPYDPAIPLLGIYPDKSVIQKDPCILMFMAALFTIAKTWKQRKCPSTEEWIKKMW